jgi:hypothetical protein
MGTVGGNVVKFDGVNWTVYNAGNSGLSLSAIADLSFDPEGNLWVAGKGQAGLALVKFDGENWMVYPLDDSLSRSDEIWDLAIGAQGNKWIATLGGGLLRFNGENWTVYNTRNSGLPSDRLYRLLIDDAAGSIWIGTEDAGVAVFRPQPVVDFNGDGAVDVEDLVRLIESWGCPDPSCDVGPTAFGDGIVDVADLEVLMSHWGQEVRDGTLLAHWALDEMDGFVAHDDARSHDATVMGLPAWQPAGGVVGGALEFDGATFVAADCVLDPTDGPFSVLAWVKGGEPGQVIVSQQGGANGLMADALDGSLMTDLRAGGRSPVSLGSQTVIVDGNWHRVAFTWDGVNRRLYVDDVLVAEDTQIALGASAGNQLIGCGATMAADTFWSGLIDDVRIYNRTVRP